MKTLKYEEVYRQEYRDLAAARSSIEHFLERVYNQKRLRSALDYRPPAEFERQLRKPPAKGASAWNRLCVFFRHGGIYRSDVIGKPKPSQPGLGAPPPVGRPPSSGKERHGRNYAPCSLASSAMSSDRLFLDRVARQCQAHAMGQNVEGTRRDNEAPGTDGSRPAMQWSSVEPVRPVWPRVAWSEQW